LILNHVEISWSHQEWDRTEASTHETMVLLEVQSYKK